MTIPHKGPPILVPGLHWEGLLVVGMAGPPTLAHMEWWTTRGEHATTQRAVDQALLNRSATAWAGVSDTSGIAATLAANVRFVVRWKKGTKLLDNWGEERKASAIGRGKRSQSYRYLRDRRTKQLIKVGVVVIPVTLLDHAQPLWLIIARLGKGREPWYLLTADPISTLAQAWALVLAYARRWQIEMRQPHYPHTRRVPLVVHPA
jgi:hypothetical protein